MNKHYLVTISNDFQNLTGLDFICSFFKKKSEHQITLLHICRLDSKLAQSPLLEMWEKPEDNVTGKLTVGAKKAMDKAVTMLNNSNMSVDEMITKTFSERYGKVKDILKEGTNGLYDAIILGKRASYTLQWFFERPADETAKAIISDSSINTPIWVCPAPEIGRRNVLVCVDGSEESYRAVDHVGYVLSKQDQHNITLLHVQNGSKLDPKDIFAKSIEQLREHDIDGGRITTDTTWGINVAATITNYALKGGFAAIATGLHGTDSGIMKKFNLAGGTTANLIQRAEKVSIWCCP